jgi:alpha-galactosidase
VTKVVLIGAGSTSFSPSVVADMARSPDLADATLALVDVDAEILEVVRRIAERIVAANESGLRIEATTDRREALPGADFVVTTFAVGGATAWAVDVEIPKKYGISMPVGDTVGPGGLSRALRHIPLVVEIARDMERLCPDAHLFNYTNPLTVLVRAVRKATSIDAVGLCAGPELTRTQLADFMGIPRPELEAHGAGVNHCFWLLDVRHDGEDVYPRARELARHVGWPAPPAEDTGYHELWPTQGTRPFVVQLLDKLGYFPGPWDRHVSEFFPEFFPDGPMADARYGLQSYPVSLIVERKSAMRDYFDRQADERNPLDPQLAHGRVGHSEEVVDVIAAVVENRGLRQFGNVPNRGLVPNLPPEAVVEVPLTFGSYGWRATQAGELPPSVLPWLSRRVAAYELTVEAALTGSRQTALQALLADGWVRDTATAGRLLDELLSAQARFLPQFA